MKDKFVKICLGITATASLFSVVAVLTINVHLYQSAKGILRVENKVNAVGHLLQENSGVMHSLLPATQQLATDTDAFVGEMPGVRSNADLLLQLEDERSAALDDVATKADVTLLKLKASTKSLQDAVEQFNP